MASELYPHFMEALRDELDNIGSFYSLNMSAYEEAETEEEKDRAFAQLTLDGKFLDTKLLPELIDVIDRGDYLPPEVRDKAFDKYAEWKTDLLVDLNKMGVKTRGLSFNVANPDNLAYTLVDEKSGRSLTADIDGNFFASSSELMSIAEEVAKDYVDPTLNMENWVSQQLHRGYQEDVEDQSQSYRKELDAEIDAFSQAQAEQKQEESLPHFA